MPRLISTRAVSARVALSPLALAAVLALALSSAGCRFMNQGPWSARPAAGAAGATDTAATDTVVAGDTLVVRDTAALDSVVAPGAVRDPLTSDSAAAPDPAPADTASGDSVPTEDRPSVEELEEMGPTYTPYDISPELLPGEWLTNLLSDTLAPVVDRHDELSVQEFALFWILVDRSGEVRDAVLHTTSDSEVYDQAARVVAQRLRYRPAVADGDSVPVWVLVRVSLLMR